MSQETLSRSPTNAWLLHENIAVRPALVLMASPEDPQHVGSVLLFGGNPRDIFVFGRGDEAVEGTGLRVRPQRQRPGALIDVGPLLSPYLSRRQLEIRRGTDDSLEVTNAGRGSLIHNGRGCTTALVVPGDLLELEGRLLLLCERRPLWLPEFGVSADFSFGEPDDDGFVGESLAMWALRAHIRQNAALDRHVFIHGPSGSGKELIARALVRHSPRHDRPFVARNAATIPEGIADAELFGSVRNYPNAGMPERRGLVGEADGGTLFLDEVAELSQGLQAHLLRLLDSGDYQRLGDGATRRAHLRVMAATNRPYVDMREDVLARFACRIEVPGLADRRADVPLLAKHLLRLAAPSAKMSLADTRELLTSTFTTNVRQLMSWVQRKLQDPILHQLVALHQAPPPIVAPTTLQPPDVVDEEQLTPQHIQAVLDTHNGSIERSFRALGLSSRYVLTRLIRKHGLVLRKRK